MNFTQSYRFDFHDELWFVSGHCCSDAVNPSALETRPAASLQEIRLRSLLILPAFVPFAQQESPVSVFIAIISKHTQSFGKRPLQPLAIPFLHR